MDNAISGIKCDAKECKYHAPEDKCVASSIRVNSDATHNDALCKTFEKKDCFCK